MRKTPFQKWLATKRDAAVWRHPYAAEEGWDAGYEEGLKDAVPTGYKLVPIVPTNEIVCAIEARVENMIEASAMCCEMHRLDGDYIWEAAIAAVKGK